MGRGNSYKKVIVQFIRDIPDSKLAGGMSDGATIWEDRNMRLDNQRTFKGSDGKYYYNLQVQVNRGCTNTTLKMLAPDTVAICHAPADKPWSPEKIREALAASVTGGRLGRG